MDSGRTDRGDTLPRPPVPQVTEEFALTKRDRSTVVEYSRELGTDFGIAGNGGPTG
jgi:hypothetical protein